MSLDGFYKNRRMQIIEALGQGHPNPGPSAFGTFAAPEEHGVTGSVIGNNGMQRMPSNLPVSSGNILSLHQATQHLQSSSQPQQIETYKSLPRGIAPARGPRTRFFDPLSLMYATGYKDRRFSVSYETLRQVTQQVPLIGAIINTRVNQISAFAQPYRENRQVGFQIRLKDDSHEPSEEEQTQIKRVEQFIMECGFGPNPHSPYPRDKFEVFLRKFTRDSLRYDQACFEVIPDTRGRPYEYRCVDAATIRLASTYDGYRGSGPQRLRAEQFTDRWQRLYGEDFQVAADKIFTVQILHGRIENIFTFNDLAFCIRNPRSDIWANGYGFAEVEMALNTVLGMLWGEEYNRRFFQQGAAPKGIINVKGENIDPQELEAFRRQWYSMIAGVENSWRTPILQADALEYQNLQQTNREMEFQGWLEYLLRIISAVFLIDPSEVNFDLTSAGGQAPLFESKHEWKIKHSRDKGLRPLLRFIARCISEYIIDPLDDRLYLDFVGLDELSERDRVELLNMKMSAYMKLNEGREAEGLPPLPDGDIILNPTYIQYKSMLAGQGQDLVDPEKEQQRWLTSGEHEAPGYGEAQPVPLWKQVSPPPQPADAQQ